MTPEEAVAKLDAIQSGKDGYLDVEDAHIKTDNILRSLLRSIAPEVADAYSRLRERTGDWWFA